MSSFTPLVVKTFKFEDDAVKVKFRRLKRKHLLKLLPLVGKVKKDDDESTLYDIAEELLGKFGDSAIEYIVEITGLTDAEGNDVEVATVTEESYFFQLYTDIIVAMIEESMGPSGKV